MADQAIAVRNRLGLSVHRERAVCRNHLDEKGGWGKAAYHIRVVVMADQVTVVCRSRAPMVDRVIVYHKPVQRGFCRTLRVLAAHIDQVFQRPSADIRYCSQAVAQDGSSYRPPSCQLAYPGRCRIHLFLARKVRLGRDLLVESLPCPFHGTHACFRQIVGLSSSALSGLCACLQDLGQKH